jgi:hypothetical protein
MQYNKSLLFLGTIAMQLTGWQVFCWLENWGRGGEDLFLPVLVMKLFNFLKLKMQIISVSEIRSKFPSPDGEYTGFSYF